MSVLSIFRKVALSLWKDAGDPSVYGFFELDVTGLKDRTLILPLILQSLNVTMLKNPELNSYIKWGKATTRKEILISVMVHIPGSKDDLSVLNIAGKNNLSAKEIREIIDKKSNMVRSRKDPHLGPVLHILSKLPHAVIKYFLKLYAFLIYEFDTRLGIKSLPHRPFGSVIVSNIGSLGLRKALLPLVPLARASMLMSVGQMAEEPRVFNGQICIREIIHLGITFDHRLFDGSHAARMVKDFEEDFYSSLRNCQRD